MESEAVREFIRREVKDWEEEAIATARFKAFSGQRSDWEARYQFWRDLILKLIVEGFQVKKDWFNRGGLTPLCLDHVLMTCIRIVQIGVAAAGMLFKWARVYWVSVAIIL
ncbi:hypothetical protein CK203_068106 [Vitis vinifera]|uniref:Uncharacterized protein n=1 Tax=Vitis vinifera TaxID=29760 RepID=A0A438E1G2_VITVI|nr:hypothetical protein CK203_068106 [Vitis vinifera]